MGEVRPRRSGLRREVRPAAARRQHASGGRELAPRRPRGQRGTARAAGLRLTAARCGSTSTRSGRSVGACRGATAPVAGLSGNAGARGGTRRRFPRRRPAAPLLSPLDATTGATSTSSGARPAMRRRPALPRTLRAEGWARAPSAVSRVFLRRSARGVVRRAQGAGEQRRRAAERASRGPLRLSASTARSHVASPLAPLPLVAPLRPAPVARSAAALRSRWSLRPSYWLSGSGPDDPGRSYVSCVSHRDRCDVPLTVERSAGARPSGARATQGNGDHTTPLPLVAARLPLVAVYPRVRGIQNAGAGARSSDVCVTRIPL